VGLAFDKVEIFRHHFGEIVRDENLLGTSRFWAESILGRQIRRVQEKEHFSGILGELIGKSRTGSN